MSVTSAPRLAPLNFQRAQAFSVSVVAAVGHDADGARLVGLLRALRDARVAIPYEVIVVARGAAAAGLRCAFPLVSLFKAPADADLGTCFDLGLKAAAGRYLLLLDGAAVPDAAAVAELVRFADSGQWIGAVVPRYVAADGAERAASRRFPTPLAALREAYGWGAATEVPAPRLQLALNRMVTTPKEVEAAEPGCVLIRRQAALDAGGFAAGYAPGGEVLDWCKRARRKGWAVFFHPGVQARTLPDAPLPDRLAIARRFIHRFHGVLPALALGRP